MFSTFRSCEKGTSFDICDAGNPKPLTCKKKSRIGETISDVRDDDMWYTKSRVVEDNFSLVPVGEWVVVDRKRYGLRVTLGACEPRYSQSGYAIPPPSLPKENYNFLKYISNKKFPFLENNFIKPFIDETRINKVILSWLRRIRESVGLIILHLAY